MKLHSLEITNFRSFGDRQVFKFAEEPGLYFMKGDNRADERLGGNGAGKSSIWEALHWLAHGTTSEGLKAGQVCNWDVSKGVVVSLIYFSDIDNEQYEVRRTWGPISWTLTLFTNGAGATKDLTKDPDNAFLAELRTSIEIYEQCVMMAQHVGMFLDLKPDHQAALFSTALGQDKWLEYSARASRMAIVKDDECRRLESEVAELRGQLSSHRNYGQEISDFEARRKDRLASVESEYSRILRKQTAAKERFGEVMLAENEARNELKPLTDALEARRDEYKAMQDTIGDLTDIAAGLRTELGIIEDSIRFLEKHDHCPTCDLDLDPAVKKKALVDKQEARTMLVGKLTKSTRNMDDRRNMMQRLRKRIDEDEKAHDAQSDRVHALVDKRQGLKFEIDAHTRDLKHLEDEADAIESEVNPYKQLQDTAAKATRTAQDRFSAATKALTAASELQSRYAFWVRGFKDVRLRQIADALSELEVEVNSELSALGLPGWELMFSVDKETKSGGVSRGFSVNVISPKNSQPVPWKAWSGGERQRLRLATQMGLANLIRTRMGVTIGLEVWDEPTKGLSPWGVQDLLQALQRRALIEQRQIWIVDHSSHNFGGFAGTATVIKDKNGSRIEQA